MRFEAALRRARSTLLFLLDTLVARGRRPARTADAALVVRLDAIGDFVLWVDAARELSAYLRGRGLRSVLVANSAWASWAEEMALFDEVLAVDVRRFLASPVYRAGVQRRVRGVGAKLAVNPTFSRAFLLDDSVMRACGAEERIGSEGPPAAGTGWRRRLADRWYSRLLAAAPGQQMELQRNAEFMRNLGVADFRSKLPVLEFLRKAVAEYVPGGTAYYVLFPGASWDGRMWPVERFAEMAARIHQETGWLGVVCGGPADVGLAERLCALGTVPLLNLAGRTGLAELASVLAQSRLLLTNETSAVHIAAACRVPTVCIAGGGHFGRFVPYRMESADSSLPNTVSHPMPCFHCDWDCIYKPSSGEPVPCIAQVSSTSVWGAICATMGWARRTSPDEVAASCSSATALVCLGSTGQSE